MSHADIPGTKALVLAVFFTVGAGWLVGCSGGGGEQALIRNFFTATRVNDRPTLGNIAMVAYDMDAQGNVASFDVENVTEEQRRPLRMRELTTALQEAQATQQEHAAGMKAYQDENLEAISRVIEAERAGEDVASRDQEVQETWTQWRQEAQEYTRQVADAEAALSAESQVAMVSAFDPSNPIDVQQFDGELISKEVTITADVEQNGASEQRTMVITLQKVTLGSGEEMIDGRWIITDIS